MLSLIYLFQTTLLLKIPADFIFAKNHNPFAECMLKLTINRSYMQNGNSVPFLLPSQQMFSYNLESLQYNS